MSNSAGMATIQKDEKVISSSDLAKLKLPYLAFVSGPLNNSAKRPLPPENWQEGHSVFVSTADKLTEFIARGAPLIICLEKNLPRELAASGADIFSTPSIAAGLATLHSFFDDKASRFTKGIHPTAFVSPSAKILEGVSIGPFAVVGDHVVIGKASIIGAHTVIEKNVRIGEQTLLHPHVFIGADCLVGSNCEIHPHTSIGSDGFGFVKDPKGAFHKIPQLGNVVVEDRVEIGSNCAIDRAAMHSTFIRAGTKLDNLIHIAHNCDIGGDSAIAAGFMVAGSTVIGPGLMTGGDVVVADHLKITSNVSLGGRTAVTKDILESGVYLGHPAEPYGKGMKIMATLSSLPEIKKQLNKIVKHLGLDKENP